MKRREIAAPSYDHDISALFSFLSLVLLATLALATLLYGEPFRFWQHAFSDLGNTVTRGGHANTASRLTFSVGMIIQSVVMLRISSRYSGDPDLRNRTVKRWLALIGAVGFLVSVYPNDVNHFVHSVGAGTVIGVVYLFTMIFHLELRPLISAPSFYADLITIQAAVLSYAAAFFADSDTKQSLQKTCVLGVFFALQRSVTIAEESFRPGEVLGAFRRFQH